MTAAITLLKVGTHWVRPEHVIAVTDNTQAWRPSFADEAIIDERCCLYLSTGDVLVASIDADEAAALLVDALAEVDE